MTLLNKLKKIINRPKQIMKKGQQIRLLRTEMATVYKADGFLFKAPIKIGEGCLLEFVENTFNRVKFKVNNYYVATEIEADTGDIIYFDVDEFKKLDYKKVE